MTNNNFAEKLVSSYLAGKILTGSDLARFIAENHSQPTVCEPDVIYGTDTTSEVKEVAV